MAAMPDRLSGAILFKAPELFNGHGFADLIAPRRRASTHPAPLHRVYHAITQVLRIWLRHPCWPPPSQQIESEASRFGNPQLDSTQRQRALDKPWPDESPIG